MKGNRQEVAHIRKALPRRALPGCATSVPLDLGGELGGVLGGELLTRSLGTGSERGHSMPVHKSCIKDCRGAGGKHAAPVFRLHPSYTISCREVPHQLPLEGQPEHVAVGLVGAGLRGGGRGGSRSVLPRVPLDQRQVLACRDPSVMLGGDAQSRSCNM